MGSPSQQPLEQILRIHCVKVFVRNQEQSLRFYLDQLGFRLVADTVLQSGERWLAVAPPDEQGPAAIPFGIRADLADEWARRVGEEIAPQGRPLPGVGPPR